ncbi:Zinc finger protein [Plakobranchus ocellatus]|uniref:Zinc finger protein n=1 Tax=Plakobranchus ocellatus TaxID=259542 RepID=A0AAV3ZYJ0_9GAST|nr:Zinc finger protein [Plakobranchus ocellatus]
MQWVGSIGVLATVGANNYRINVNGKEKTFHSNLLKRYITRDTSRDGTPTADGSVSAASRVVAEDDDEESSCDDCGCEVLPELGG